MSIHNDSDISLPEENLLELYIAITNHLNHSQKNPFERFIKRNYNLLKVVDFQSEYHSFGMKQICLIYVYY